MVGGTDVGRVIGVPFSSTGVPVRASATEQLLGRNVYAEVREMLVLGMEFVLDFLLDGGGIASDGFAAVYEYRRRAVYC